MFRTIKTNFNVDAARAFVEEVQFDKPYYVFAANAGEDEPVVRPSDDRETEISTYDNMLFGKRLRFTDVKLCARRYDWIFGTVYDMYDDQVDLSDKKFYVVTDIGVDLNIYKCLYNNGGAASIVEPFGTSPEPFETLQDGYIWKYMCTIDSVDVAKFANRTQVPVSEQPEVIAAAQPGSIDVIQIENPGILYNNYTVGTFGLTSDLRVNGNPLLYALSGNASTINGFYKNCLIKINSNSASNGQYRLIVDYQIVNGRKLITLDSPFDVTPVAADGYEIYPNVFVYDTSSTATEECVARAIINPNQANSISKVEILAPGAGYRSAVAKIKPDPSVDVLPETAALVRPIISPTGGHGSDPFTELQAYFVGISSFFSGNSVPLIANNTFKTVGVLKEPLYANCTVELDSNTVSGVFLPGEKIFRYRPIQLTGTVELFANNLVIGNDTQFTIALRENERVLITNSNNNIFANVIILDDLTMRLTSNVGIDAANCNIYLTPAEYFAECVEFDSPMLNLTKVTPVGFSSSQFMFGETSQAYARTIVDPPYLTIGSRDVDDFSAFNQITRLEGVKASDDEFDQNELVAMDISVEEDVLLPTAKVHSYESGSNSQFDSIYLTDIRNQFSANGTIKTTRTDNTQVTFNIVNKYDGELIVDSGEILYLENLNAIQRTETQVEIIKLYLEF